MSSKSEGACASRYDNDIDIETGTGRIHSDIDRNSKTMKNNGYTERKKPTNKIHTIVFQLCLYE